MIDSETILPAILKGFQHRLFIYFSIGGSLSFMIYLLFRRQNPRYKIQDLAHKWRDVRREIKYSISSLLIFSVMSLGLFTLMHNDMTLMYDEKDGFGMHYYYLSIFLALVVHDTYFYWTHRLLHTRWFMRKIHNIHHQSHDPTLWAAFSFHPIEAIINFGVFFVLVNLIPLHQSVFLIFFIVNSSNNILGHCGFEIFPKSFTKHWLGKWITTSTHHNMHHNFGKGNYALYFTWLDSWFGTEHPNYHIQFDNSISKRKINKA